MWLTDDTTPARVAPTRIYRWERDEDSYDHDGGMVLRTDDERSQDDAYMAQVWRNDRLGRWDWMTDWMSVASYDGCAATADAARRACELAVLHGEAHHDA